MKHVVLFGDEKGEAARALREALRAAGVGVRAAGEEAAESLAADGEPLAALCLVNGVAETRALRAAALRAFERWPGVPLVAFRAGLLNGAGQSDGTHLESGSGQPEAGNGQPETGNGQPLEAGTLRRLGFRAVADDPAQVPALLREIEARGQAVEPATEEAQPRVAVTPALPVAAEAESARAAFALVSALHLAGDQRSAAATALAHLEALVRADRWTLYLAAGDTRRASDEPALEPLAVGGQMGDEQSSASLAADDWRRALLGDETTPAIKPSQAVRAATRAVETVCATEAEGQLLALPLVNGERVVGALEALRLRVDGAHVAGEKSVDERLDAPRAAFVEDGCAVAESWPAENSFSPAANSFLPVEDGFAPAEVELLAALAAPLAAALANAARIAEAERLSQTDDLTKLRNARFLRQYLISEIKRARRYSSSVAALFLDLDDFKRINDEQGHLVGSHILMELAAVILGAVRDTDVVARYGGDEFVIVLPETDLEQATRVADRVRQRLAAHRFTGGRRLSLRLTASFGVAGFPLHAQSPQQLIARADAAMYEAKAAGKDCVRLAEG